MERLTVRQKVSYGLGSFGKDLINGMWSTYLMIFYTDVLGIGAAIAGMILMIARIWDALVNPVIGSCIDRTNTRWGRFRPYILLAPVPFVLFAVLSFTVPGFGMTGKIIFAAVTYILAGTFFTCYDVSLWSMLPSVTKNVESRNSLIAIARICTTIAMFFASAFGSVLVGVFGKGNSGHGYVRLMIIIAVFSLIFAWLVFFNLKEVVSYKASRTKFKEYTQVLVNNKPLYFVLAAVVFNACGMSFHLGVGVYFMTYFLGMPQLIPVYMAVNSLAGILGAGFSNVICKKLGNKKTVLISMIIGIVANILVFVLARQIFPLFLVFHFIASATVAILLVTLTGMVAEVSDYTEHQKGIRADGIIFALNSFAMQLGFALSSGIIGFVLQFTGYNAHSQSQSAHALFGINILKGIIPAIFCLLVILVVQLYPISKSQYESIRLDLQNRHSQLENKGEV